MKNVVTLKKFIASLPEKEVFVLCDKRAEWDALSPIQQRLKVQKGASTVYVALQASVNQGKFFLEYIQKTPRRYGKRVFVKTTRECYVYAENNTLKIKAVGGLSNDMIAWFLSLCGRTWAIDLSSRLLRLIFNKPALLKGVLTGRIYSEETLIKRIATQLYHIKGVNWRLLRDYINTGWVGGHSLTFYNDFTKDINKTLEVLIEIHKKDDYEKSKLINDILENAFVLDRKVDLGWSDKRLEAEHRKMVEEILSYEISCKDKTLIHAEPLCEDGFEMLNSEEEIFKEGSTMHHCLYTNYFRRINQRQYLAFHTQEDGQAYTVGISLDKNANPVLDQAHGRYNSPCGEGLRSRIEAFIASHACQLQRLFAKGSEALDFEPNFIF